MNQVRFKRVKFANLEALQCGLLNYSAVLQAGLKPQMNLQFFDDVQQLSLAHKIFKTFRGKLERRQEVYTFALTEFEAVALLYSCANTENIHPEPCYDTHVAGMYKNLIDEQLKSNNLWNQPPQTTIYKSQHLLPQSGTAIT